MSERVTATIRPGQWRGWEVRVAGKYWTTFPTYDEAAEACHQKGYMVL